MNVPAKIEAEALSNVTRGYVQATLGEALMCLRMMCNQAEREGQDVSHYRSFIEEADAIRWAA